MKIKLHQDVLGHRSGDTIDLEATEAQFYLREGYASKVRGSNQDMHLAGGVDAENDPTLAANREHADDFDAAAAEDEATNDDESKLADAEDAQREKLAPATQKRDPRIKDTADDTETSEV